MIRGELFYRVINSDVISCLFLPYLISCRDSVSVYIYVLIVVITNLSPARLYD